MKQFAEIGAPVMPRPDRAFPPVFRTALTALPPAWYSSSAGRGRKEMTGRIWNSRRRGAS